MTTRPKNQPSLFAENIAPAPAVNSPTSRAAAIASEPKRGKQSIAVLEFIQLRGKHGATRHEIAAGLNVPLSSVCARVSEVGGLVGSGLIIEQGERMGPYGQWVAVLVSAVQRTLEIGRN